MTSGTATRSQNAQSTADELQGLLDKQAITELLYRRAKALDDRDVPAQLECFTEDSIYNHGDFEGSFREFITTATVSARPNSPVTALCHIITNVIVTFRDGDTADVTCYYICPYRQRTTDGAVDVLLAGRYVDVVVRREGRWLIARRDVEYHWSHTAPTGLDSWLAAIQ